MQASSGSASASTRGDSDRDEFKGFKGTGPGCIHQPGRAVRLEPLPVLITFFVELLFLIGFALSAFYHLRSTAASTHVVFSWLLYLSPGLSLTRLTWNNDADFLRALSEFYVLGALIMIGSTAVVTVLSTWRGKANNQEYSSQFQATHVWVKQQGRWQLVAAHVSPVKK